MTAQSGKEAELEAQILDLLLGTDGQTTELGFGVFSRKGAFLDTGSQLGDLFLAVTATFDFLSTFVAGHLKSSDSKLAMNTHLGNPEVQTKSQSAPIVPYIPISSMGGGVIPGCFEEETTGNFSGKGPEFPLKSPP